ncbi:GL16432 [Drosophila persimilis]|uniref:GL16432 n=1 Tax=Drosophila persimilis TaxID=7234 RepID=B4GWI6_DROPE|nr:GL16432 [Drosophila persimilis]
MSETGKLQEQQGQQGQQLPVELLECDIDFDEELPQSSQQAQGSDQSKANNPRSEKLFSQAIKKVTKVQRMLEQAMALLAEEEAAEGTKSQPKKSKKQHKKDKKKDKKKAKKQEKKLRKSAGAVGEQPDVELVGEEEVPTTSRQRSAQRQLVELQLQLEQLLEQLQLQF